MKQLLAVLGGGMLSDAGDKRQRESSSRFNGKEFTIVALLWTVYVVLALGIVLDRNDSDIPTPIQVAVSPVLIPAVWFAAHTWRRPISEALARLRAPGWLIFFSLGLALSLITVGSTIGFGLTVRAADDLPRAASTLVYVGPWLGLLAAVWWVRRRWRLGPHHLFWLLGISGAAAEYNGLLPVLLFDGQLTRALLLAIYLIPAYGVGVAATLGLMPDTKLPATKRPPNIKALLWLGLAMWFLFSLCSYAWTALLTALL